jgi:hypothetical protein
MEPVPSRAIEGVLTFFITQDIEAPESWISYVDADIVEAIERGGTIALNMPSASWAFKTGGAYEWANFLRGMRDGPLNGRNVSGYLYLLAVYLATC